MIRLSRKEHEKILFSSLLEEKVLAVLGSEMTTALHACARLPLHPIPSLTPSLAKASTGPAQAQLNRHQVEDKGESGAL